MGLGADKKEWIRTADILERLEKASDDRIFRVKDAMRLGVPTKTIKNLTKIDTWFLKQIKRLVKMEKELMSYNVPEDIPETFFRNSSLLAMPMLKSPGYCGSKKKKSPNKEKNLVSIVPIRW